MRNRMKKWMNFWLTAAAVSLLLTGCVKPSAGGEKTRLGMRALEENDTTAALTYFEEARADGEDPPDCHGTGHGALFKQKPYSDCGNGR